MSYNENFGWVYDIFYCMSYMPGMIPVVSECVIILTKLYDRGYCHFV